METEAATVSCPMASRILLTTWVVQLVLLPIGRKVIAQHLLRLSPHVSREHTSGQGLAPGSVQSKLGTDRHG
jgi:hypothetical protein